MLASPSPFHPQQMASSMLHRPETTTSDLVRPPPGLLGFRPLGHDQRMQMQDNDEEDMNGTDMESDLGSDNDDINDIDSEKLDASHKEILEKLKRQELEEREEIERELKEAQREALVNAQRHEELRAQELRALEEQERTERGLEDMMGPLQTEIKMQRPLGLLAQHGLKSRAHPCDREREHKEKTEKDSPSKEKAPEKELERAASRDRPLPLLFDRDRPLPLTLPLPRPDLDFPHPAFIESRGFGPPSHPESPRSIGTPGLDGSGSTGAQTPAGHHWTFEEQFKQQLYELSEDPKRREFLDDLFCYMQKRGTPVNRIPIMAKQTLDLYELFRLVVSKGGLVEVINKKLWREITKGLNLPSSITSAAFTLRTQYMKYLYPYECEKLKLSNPAELQAAIDGNRREGRRPSYGYDFSPIPSMIPTPPGPHMNGGFHPGHPLNGRPHLSTPPKEEDHLLGSLHMANLAERDARAMEAAARAMEEATKRMEEARVSKMAPTPVGSKTTSSTPTTKLSEPPLGQPPLKRPMLDEERFMAHLGMPSTHLKITSRGDGRNEFDNSMVVSMEINGVMYQGVLFAQHGHPRRI